MRPVMTGILAVTAAVSAGIAIQRIGAHSVDKMVEPHAAYWLERGQSQLLDNALFYIALGDSAAQGVGVTDPELSYVAQIATKLEQRFDRPCFVANLSVSGAKAADVIAEQIPRMQQLIEQLGQPDIVTMVIGGNDVALPGWNKKDLDKNLHLIASLLPPGSTMGETPSFGYGIGELRSKTATSIIRDAATRQGHSVAPLYHYTRTRFPFKIFHDTSADYFHPNARGYRLWAKALWAGIEHSKQFKILNQESLKDAKPLQPLPVSQL